MNRHTYLMTIMHQISQNIHNHKHNNHNNFQPSHPKFLNSCLDTTTLSRHSLCLIRYSRKDQYDDRLLAVQASAIAGNCDLSFLNSESIALAYTAISFQQGIQE